MTSKDCGCVRAPQNNEVDRYVSFSNIDCAGNARLMMQRLEQLAAGPAQNNLFWAYFSKKRAPASGPKPDDLFLIHSNINQIREMLETYADVESLQLLQQIEEECC